MFKITPRDWCQFFLMLAQEHLGLLGAQSGSVSKCARRGPIQTRSLLVPKFSKYSAGWAFCQERAKLWLRDWSLNKSLQKHSWFVLPLLPSPHTHTHNAHTCTLTLVSQELLNQEVKVKLFRNLSASHWLIALQTHIPGTYPKLLKNPPPFALLWRERNSDSGSGESSI